MLARRLACCAVLLLLIAAFVAPTASGFPHVPQIPKGALPIKYPVTISTTGSVDYTWTYDTREKCHPGYALTVSEHLTFTSKGPIRGEMAVIGGKSVSTPFKGGSWKLDVRVADWKETNYCDGPPAKIKKPVCHDLDGGGIAFAVGPESASLQEGEDDLEPIVHNSNFIVSATSPVNQDFSCYEARPDIETIGEKEKDWAVDPAAGMSLPLGTTGAYLHDKLKVGKTLRRQIAIGGRCDGGTAKASALPEHVTSCALSGRVRVTIKRTG
jgi:hypothetical protein